jgi:mutator protein MutT
VSRPLDVTAAVIQRGGRYLVTRRHPAKHLGGLWEFPGGKRQRGETLGACLARELREELGVRVRVGEPLLVVSWTYPGRQVVLHFFRCDLSGGRLEPREGQPYRWVTRRELAALPMPPADDALVARLAAAGPPRRRRSAGVDRTARPGRPRPRRARASARRASASAPADARDASPPRARARSTPRVRD